MDNTCLNCSFPHLSWDLGVEIIQHAEHYYTMEKKKTYIEHKMLHFSTCITFCSFSISHFFSFDIKMIVEEKRKSRKGTVEVIDKIQFNNRICSLCSVMLFFLKTALIYWLNFFFVMKFLFKCNSFVNLYWKDLGKKITLRIISWHFHYFHDK